MNCVVYVIALDPEHGPSKVGLTRDPQKRLSALQTGHHQKLTLYGYWDLPDRQIARAIEESFHDVLADSQLSGEWFDIPPERCMALLMLSIEAALSVHTKFSPGEISNMLEMSRQDCVRPA